MSPKKRRFYDMDHSQVLLDKVQKEFEMVNRVEKSAKTVDWYNHWLDMFISPWPVLAPAPGASR